MGSYSKTATRSTSVHAATYGRHTVTASCSEYSHKRWTILGFISYSAFATVPAQIFTYLLLMKNAEIGCAYLLPSAVSVKVIVRNPAYESGFLIYST